MDYIIKVGKNYDAFSQSQLEELLKDGTFSVSEVVYSKKEKRWGFVGDLPEFKPSIPKCEELPIERAIIYVQKEGAISGPFSRPDMYFKISNGELGPYDYVYVDGQPKWMMLRQIKEFRQFFDQMIDGLEKDIEKIERLLLSNEKTAEAFKKVEAPPEKTAKRDKRNDGDDDQVITVGIGHFDLNDTFAGETFEIANDAVWIYLDKDGSTEQGPMTVIDLLEAIKAGAVSKQQLAQKNYQDEWRPMADIYELNIKYIKKVLEIDGKQVVKVYGRRRYPRSPYFGPTVMMKDGKSIRGDCTVISQNGCFIETINPTRFHENEIIDIQIFPAVIPMKIETKARVVSVTSKAPKGVSLEFKGLGHSMSEEIDKYVRNFLAQLRR